MSPSSTQRSLQIREVIDTFLQTRLSSKLEKLLGDDPKRIKLQGYFVAAVWLADAARRVKQISAVTHSLKAIHPDAKGTTVFCAPATLPMLSELGTHSLGVDFMIDVVGNSAALDVYKFLRQVFDGRTLLELALAGDVDLPLALSDDHALGHAWMVAFAGLVNERQMLSSHTLAKQVYWLVDTDPHTDDGFHLLAPLYPTSLVQRVHEIVQDDRFGESAKAARAARKVGDWHERQIHEYPDLATQSMGGTKPQNISHLNSERGGDNYLLASLPPLWSAGSTKPLLGVDSMFSAFGRRQHVRSLVQSLRDFLEADPTGNAESRATRDALVDAIVDELLQFAAEFWELEAGWSDNAACTLPPTHCAWLDPDWTGTSWSDAGARVAGDFANWINAQLRRRLPVGDAEFLHWRNLAWQQFRLFEREGMHVE
jgi:CRISPR-associated protein Csy1